MKKIGSASAGDNKTNIKVEVVINAGLIEDRKDVYPGLERGEGVPEAIEDALKNLLTVFLDNTRMTIEDRVVRENRNGKLNK